MSEIKVNKISPATSTDITLGDSGDTFTVPSGATIVNSGTATGFGGGKIGQVLTVQNLDQESTSASSWVEIPDLSVTITPTATDSKIWIVSCLTIGWAKTQQMFQLMRDSTAIGVGTAVDSMAAASFSVGYNEDSSPGPYYAFPSVFTWLDSPSTTSAIDYTMQWDCYTGFTSYLNSCNDQSDSKYYCRTPSSITVMEVLA